MALAQHPSVGRIVHYVIPSGPRIGEHRPAIITQVWTNLDSPANPGMSNLTVFRGQSDDFSEPGYAPVMVGSVLYSDKANPGSWHWPERD